VKSNNDAVGITQLSNKDAIEIENILPLITNVARRVINSIAGGTFELKLKETQADTNL
jgi:hypothetical protein